MIIATFGNSCERLKIIYLADFARFFLVIVFSLLEFWSTLLISYSPVLLPPSVLEFFGD
jgi:hypothetical protein